jgi:hypothetical protein
MLFVTGYRFFVFGKKRDVLTEPMPGQIVPLCFISNPKSKFYSGCQKYIPINRHCEELCNEAIFCETEAIASLRSQ